MANDCTYLRIDSRGVLYCDNGEGGMREVVSVKRDECSIRYDEWDSD
jgi:hypothetical protein